MEAEGGIEPPSTALQAVRLFYISVTYVFFSTFLKYSGVNGVSGVPLDIHTVVPLIPPYRPLESLSEQRSLVRQGLTLGH